MNAARIVDAAIEAPVVTSCTRLGYETRRRLDGWRSLDDYDMTGRVVVVTGATSGLGRAAALQLAHCGATLVLVGRDATRNEDAANAIAAAASNPSITHVEADMGDNEQVRALAERVLADHDRLDVLVHNAGSLSATRQVAPDGTEATVASQVVGPFLLTSLLLDRLESSQPSRVITMSSGGMYTARLHVGGLQMDADTYGGAEQYARAKRAQVVLNEMWADRAGHRGITFHSMHPGWASTPGVDASLPRFAALKGPTLRSAEQGADTLDRLAPDDEALGSNGAFWLDRRQRATHRVPGTRSSDTPERRARLWDWVVETAGAQVPGAGSA